MNLFPILLFAITLLLFIWGRRSNREMFERQRNANARWEKALRDNERLQKLMARVGVRASLLATELNKAGVPLDDPRRLFAVDPDDYQEALALGMHRIFGLKLVVDHSKFMAERTTALDQRRAFLARHGLSLTALATEDNEENCRVTELHLTPGEAKEADALGLTAFRSLLIIADHPTMSNASPMGRGYTINRENL